MSDINSILSKHFTGETTPEEEILVQQFKLENPEEYLALQAFWTNKEVNVSEFDTTQGWKKVVQKSKPAKRVFLTPTLKWVASTAAIFLIAMVGLYLYNNLDTPSDLVKITATIQNQKVELEDSSVIYLNKDASLSYPDKFSSNRRDVTLNGEAFFEVAKDANRPFRILTNHSEVEVLGTSFNIDTKADQTEVSVTTGKVQVRSLRNDVTAILTPNQSAFANDNTINVVPTIDQNYMAWKTGVFNFEKAPIKDVIEKLNTYYNNQITLSKTDSDCLFNLSFNQLDIKEIVEIIQLTCNLKLNKKNNNYELH